MYKKCATCPKLGITCNEFDLLALSTDEMREWCRWRLVWLGWPRVRLVEEAKTPKSTIDRFFSNEPCDFKFETFRPIVKALIGGEKVEHPCPMCDIENDTEKLQQEKELLQAEIERITADNEQMQQYIRDHDAQHKADHENTANALRMLEGQLKVKQTAVNVLILILAVVVVALIGVLIYDKITPHLGWFRQ